MAATSGAERVHVIARSMGDRGLPRAIDRIAATAAKDANVPFNQIIWLQLMLTATHSLGECMATGIGEIADLVHAAGVSPTRASPAIR
jgi:hypothetical protein